MSARRVFEVTLFGCTSACFSAPTQLTPVATPTYSDPNRHAGYASIEGSVNRVSAREGLVSTTSNVHVVTAQAEAPLRPDFVAVGARQSLALATLANQDSIGASNTEVWARGIARFTSSSSFAGTLGIVLPTTTLHASPDSERAVRLAALAQPGNRPLYAYGELTLRPGVEFRHRAGRFFTHFRQGVDFGVLATDNTRATSACLAVAVAYRASESIAFGVEALERYDLDADLRDDGRATFLLTPFFRWHVGPIEPMVAFSTSLGSPLETISSFGGRPFQGTSDLSWAFRTGMVIPFGAQ